MNKKSKQSPRDRLRRAHLRFWRLAEGRAIFEWQSFYALRPLLRRLPKGDGHPVLVLPGFLAGDRSTAPMRSLLTDLGYDAHGWRWGRNVTVDEALQTHLLNLVTHLHQNSGQKVSLVGWSLGGLYARELAKALPDSVRCVISLGSPISGRYKDSNASRLFASINGRHGSAHGQHSNSMNQPPPVPTTSIYSRTDGIVYWRGSVQKDHPFPHHAQTENIEVPASHLGLGVNALAMVALADRLEQKEGEWIPFANKGWRALVFRRPSQRLSERLRAVFN